VASTVILTEPCNRCWFGGFPHFISPFQLTLYFNSICIYVRIYVIRTSVIVCPYVCDSIQYVGGGPYACLNCMDMNVTKYLNYMLCLW